MRSGFVAVVGRPNVGKSTLVNALVGEKVAITSSRPQTTRSRIRGVVTHPLEGEPQYQVVLVDTPGLHRPRTTLGERLNRLVHGTLAEVDAVLLVIDAVADIGPGDRLVAERSAAAGSPVVVAVNKVDLAKSTQLADQLVEAGLWDFEAYVPVSAMRGDGLAELKAELVPFLPEGPLYFPPGQTTDQPESVVVSELIREKFLDRLREEVPHSLVVVTETIEQRPRDAIYVGASVIVERESQKGIVIGKGGALLRDSGAEARAELEALFGADVFLDLRVRVEKDWQQRPGALDRLGFEEISGG